MMQNVRKDSRLPAYMAYPRFLMDIDISDTAKLVYVLLLDRARLSMQNDGWADDQGHVFVVYTVKALAETIRKSEVTVKTSLSALEHQTLISRKRQGAGVPNKIYVRIPAENCPAVRKSHYNQTAQKLSANNKYNQITDDKYEYQEGDSL